MTCPATPIEVSFGSASVTGTPVGLLGSSSMTVIAPVSPVGGIVDLTLVQLAGAPNEKRVTSPAAWDYIAPHIDSVLPAQASWYSAAAVTLHGQNFTPSLPAQVLIGDEQALPATVLDAQTATFSIPANQLLGAGPQPLRLRQNGVDAITTWTILPSLSANFTGTAATGGSLALDLNTQQSGLAYAYVSASLIPGWLSLGGIHGLLDLEPTSVVILGVAGLAQHPTFQLPVPPLPDLSGASLYFQAFAFEAGTAGTKFSLTNSAAVGLP